MMAAAAVALALAAPGAGAADAGKLPFCGNRTVQRVVKRVGCTVGDTRCWYRANGFCTNHVDERLAAKGRSGAAGLVPVPSRLVEAGDVAAFASRAHYAFVERVLRDAAGAPVAVEISEANYGRCWVDERAMVTDRYGVVTRRRVELAEVDGGFLRAPPKAR